MYLKLDIWVAFEDALKGLLKDANGCKILTIKVHLAMHKKVQMEQQEMRLLVQLKVQLGKYLEVQ